MQQNLQESFDGKRVAYKETMQRKQADDEDEETPAFKPTPQVFNHRFNPAEEEDPYGNVSAASLHMIEPAAKKRKENIKNKVSAAALAKAMKKFTPYHA